MPYEDPKQNGVSIAKWQVQSSTLRSATGVSQGWNGWTSLPGFRAEGISLTKRVRDLIDVGAAKHLMRSCGTVALDAATMKQELEHVYADVSQGHCRQPWTKTSFCRATQKCLTQASPCFTGSTIMYSYGKDRFVHPQEMARMMGWPEDVELSSSISQCKYKQMIGNSVALPCLGSIIWTFYVMKEQL